MVSNENKNKARGVMIMVMTVAIACSVSGCSSVMQYIPFVGKKKQQEAVVKKLWTSGEQFVAIEKQDRQPGLSVSANERISEISVERVRTILESMEFRGTDSDKSYPLFNEDEIKILSEYIPVGLALAAPDEDVTFAIIGHYVEALGFLKKREVTTGRVFYKNGQLNIIFGDVHRELKETMGVKEDRRLNPFLPGSRAESVGVMQGVLLPKQGGEIFAKNRQDWVVFQLNQGAGGSMAAAPQEVEEEAPMAIRSNTGTMSPAPQERLTPAPVAPVPAPAPQYTAPAPAPSYTAPPPQYTGSAVRDSRRYVPQAGYQPQQPVVRKSIEDRLTILNNLRNKRLITEQEYRDKRMEILNEL